jgi:hypothetical protein
VKRLIVAALFLTACAGQTSIGEPGAPPPTAAAADQAGNRLEALSPRGDESCTHDSVWCLDASGLITYSRDGTQRATTDAVDEAEERAVWPFAIRYGETAIVGITFRRSEGYSGGGATQDVITLYQVNASSRDATPVLSLPLYGSASIRACFDQEDRRARREACADEYAFAGALSLDATNANGRPRLVFTTEAATYPGRRSRMEDSTTAPPLQQSDLRWVRDDACSYRRVLAWAPGANAYAPDQPLPECSDYFTQ